MKYDILRDNLALRLVCVNEFEDKNPEPDRATCAVQDYVQWLEAREAYYEQCREHARTIRRLMTYEKDMRKRDGRLLRKGSEDGNQ
jgi:hypothetical protein